MRDHICLGLPFIFPINPHHGIKVLRISVDMTHVCMRYWYRSACLVGNPATEDSIRRELDRQFPPDRVPVNIAVTGNRANTYATVRVTNFDHGINISEKAVPEDYALDTLAAVIETIKHVIGELRESGKFPKLWPRTVQDPMSYDQPISHLRRF
jgi:hypothetical protein